MLVNQTNKQKKRHRVVWTTIAVLAVLAMVAFTLVPLIAAYK